MHQSHTATEEAPEPRRSVPTRRVPAMVGDARLSAVLPAGQT